MCTSVYVTQPNLFPEYLPIANNMLKSFKIIRYSTLLGKYSKARQIWC
jgi:hypothetical protein